MKKIYCIVGTRPEAIKMAPVILELKSRSDEFDVRVVATAQHREMLDSVFNLFGIIPDIDLDLMTQNQSLIQVCCRVLEAVGEICAKERPDVVLAQGDTATVMASSMACFMQQIPFGHVEAGLRTGNMQLPFPEEFNRRVAGLAAHYHFAPTEQSRKNLLEERVDPNTIYVTGNPVVDALYHILENRSAEITFPWMEGKPYILMTCHRRESFGGKLERIFEQVRQFAQDYPELNICYPVHPNPNVLEPAHRILGNLDNVFLTQPLDYVSFLHAMKGCHLLLSDSGGVQEESATLGKPCLVMRDITERPEGLEAGVCELVGTDPERIRNALDRLMKSPEAYKAMTHGQQVYGNGKTAVAIADILKNN
jgi:UDP-N-acetylglucosamine 2-epimerase (non-hydrolysing)